MKNYRKRTEDVINAVRSLRSSGVCCGMPFQTADGTIIFNLEGYTLSVAQLLELLDRDRLNLDGIRALAGAQKKCSPCMAYKIWVQSRFYERPAAH
jgi:hypothetical protein